MPSFVGILEGINIRLLRPVVVTVEHQEDSQAENNESKDKEEPEEIGVSPTFTTNVTLR